MIFKLLTSKKKKNQKKSLKCIGGYQVPWYALSNSMDYRSDNNNNKSIQ